MPNDDGLQSETRVACVDVGCSSSSAACCAGGRLQWEERQGDKTVRDALMPGALLVMHDQHTNC
jgi:hypothetical protein